MRRPGPRFRTRLLVAIVAVAFGALVLSVVGTAALARRTATDAAISDLREDGPPIAETLDNLGQRFRRAETNETNTRAIQQVIEARSACHAGPSSSSPRTAAWS